MGKGQNSKGSGGPTLVAIEARRESSDALALFKRKFTQGAKTIASGATEIFWQPRIETWALFGETQGRGGRLRPWNGFGHELGAYRQNLVVEINPPALGIDTNLQGVFATDADGKRWILHQGRMSVPGDRIKQADFIAASGLKPLTVSFSDGSERPYHPVACLDAPAPDVQAAIDSYVRTCALVRTTAKASRKVANALIEVRKLEASLTPEIGGSYETAPRGSVTARRRHADVWKALAASLRKLKIEHSNARILRYGPDMFTLAAPLVLFEIKSRVEPRDVFEALGQLAIYERLLGSKYRKVLLVPDGLKERLRKPLAELKIHHLTFRRTGRTVRIDKDELGKILAP